MKPRACRWTTAGLSLLVAAGALTGCGQQKADKSANPAHAASTSAAPSSTTKTDAIDASTLGHLTPGALPDSEQAVATRLATMPSTLAGHPRTSVNGRVVQYADGSSITATPLTQAGPGMTMPTFFASFRNSGPFTVTSNGGDTGPVLWFAARATSPYHPYVAAAASRSGKWLFGIDATTPAAGSALVSALAANH